MPQPFGRVPKGAATLHGGRGTPGAGAVEQPPPNRRAGRGGTRFLFEGRSREARGANALRQFVATGFPHIPAPENQTGRGVPVRVRHDRNSRKDESDQEKRDGKDDAGIAEAGGDDAAPSTRRREARAQASERMKLETRAATKFRCALDRSAEPSAGRPCGGLGSTPTARSDRDAFAGWWASFKLLFRLAVSRG